MIVPPCGPQRWFTGRKEVSVPRMPSCCDARIAPSGIPGNGKRASPRHAAVAPEADGGAQFPELRFLPLDDARALAAGRNFPVPRVAPDTAATVRWDSGTGTPDEGRFSPNEPIRAQVRSPLRRGCAQAPRASHPEPPSPPRHLRRVSSSTNFRGSPGISPNRPLSTPKRTKGLVQIRY
jgi:hypothetical protein